MKFAKIFKSYQCDNKTVIVPDDKNEAQILMLLIDLADMIIKGLMVNSHTCPTPQVTVFLSGIKKEMPAHSNTPIGPCNCNSGWSDGQNVVVYRREEIFKVIIHELLHHYQLDTPDRTNKCHGAWVTGAILRDIDKPILVSETSTEVVAEILNIIAYCMHQNEE